MGAKKFFSNSFETTEFSNEQALTTHYYDNDYEKCKNAIVEVCNLYGYSVENIDDNYKEMLISYNKGEIIVTLFNSSYYVTSIDFKITTRYVLPCGRGCKVLDKLYNSLNSKLTLKRIGGGINGRS